MRLRALTAVALVLSFYLVVLGLLVLLVVVAVIRLAFRGSPIDCLAAAVAILKLLVSVSERRHPVTTGFRAPLVRHPGLAGLVQTLGHELTRRASSEACLLLAGARRVAHRGDSLGDGSHPPMVLTLAALQMWTVDQARAFLAFQVALSACELAELRTWIDRCGVRVARTLNVLRVHKLVLQFSFLPYARRFFRSARNMQRRHVLNADLIGARTVGKEAYSSWLKALDVGVLFSTYWGQCIAPITNLGFLPPIAEGYRRFAKEEAPASAVFRGAPSPTERLAALQALAVSPRVRDSRPAIELLQDLPEIEAGLADLRLGDGPRRWKRIQWEDSPAFAQVTFWRAQVEYNRAVAVGLTVADLAMLSEHLDELTRQYRPVPGELPSREQRRHAVLEVLSARLALVLYDAGWKIEVRPGHPIALVLDNERIEPVSIVQGLALGTIPGAEWSARAQSLGIAACRLTASTLR